MNLCYDIRTIQKMNTMTHLLFLDVRRRMALHTMDVLEGIWDGYAGCFANTGIKQYNDTPKIQIATQHKSRKMAYRLLVSPHANQKIAMLKAKLPKHNIIQRKRKLVHSARKAISTMAIQAAMFLNPVGKGWRAIGSIPVPVSTYLQQAACESNNCDWR